jgi:hypothetical protein
MRRTRPGSSSLRDLRLRLAQETARLVVEQGLTDQRQALRKAAQRLGVRDNAALPGADEIDAALREHQRLFRGSSQRQALQLRRRAALQAMQFFAGFEPRLVGGVLDGTADEHSAVELMLFSDDPDAVIRALHEHDIPHRTGTRRLRFEREAAPQSCPLHSFSADQIDFRLTVLPRDALRQAPLDGAGERPLHWASVAAVECLRDEST